MGFSSFASAGPVYILKDCLTEDVPQVKPRVFLTLRFLLTFLILAALVGAGGWLAGLRIGQIWPFFPGAVGIAGLLAGMRKRRRVSADFAIPSIVFIILSIFFALFSLRILPMRLKDFVLVYWPAIPVFALLFLALNLILFRRRHRPTGCGKDPG